MEDARLMDGMEWNRDGRIGEGKSSECGDAEMEGVLPVKVA